MNPEDLIKDSKQQIPAKAVLNAFMGHPKTNYLSYMRLKDTCWAIACEVFHPTDQWPTKDTNAFLAKILTLVSHQKNDLVSGLYKTSV